MSHPAIRVDGLWKEYAVGHARRHHSTFYDLLSHGMRSPFRRLRQLRGESVDEQDQFWALQDLSFEVQPGEVVGVIGRNGAGKSTLLKILSRITAPTKGRAEVRGRLASLLEVGTGFHAELSGRENIFLNGAILGMGKAEVARKFDEIVAFAEVERFIDTPVKRYSSGMYVRLAFAVAASLEVDVLIVDEVLAVGDSAFQEKCMARMSDLSGGGRTVLFVSHNLGAVSRLCSRGIVLQAGTKMFDGPASDALINYRQLASNAEQRFESEFSGPLTSTARLISLSINGSTEVVGSIVRPADEVDLLLTGELSRSLQDFRVTICLHKGDQMVFAMHDGRAPSDLEAVRFQSRFVIPAFFLSPGEYSLDVNMYSDRTGQWATGRQVCSFSVTPEWHSHYEQLGMVNLGRVGARTVVG